ncbi:MAG: hypothetical protein E7381_00380 [Clostridiales bacterium]|nr:hypothetical protein [Clostridiales bacterium]
MGKKKSVVLMILLTVVIVALCALVAFPAFSVPGTVDKWNPVVLQYDLGADLGGGYYAYHYPEGVISETEYEENVSALADAMQSAQDSNDTEAYEKAKTEHDEYVESYSKFLGLYLSTDPELGIVDDEGKPTQEYYDEFQKTAQEIKARYAKKGYSDYRVTVVDAFSIRVELPKSEINAGSIMATLSLTGDLTLQKGGELVDELKSEGAKASDLIKSVSVATRYKTAYLKIKFTEKGEAMIERLKEELSEASTTTDQSTATTIDIKIGEETVAQIYKDNIMDNNREARVLPVEQQNKAYVETFEILLESALENGGFDVTFQSLATSEIRTFKPVYGEKVLTLLYIALAVVILALLVLPVIFMGRYGVAGLYSTLSYFIITTICFAFISKGVFEITLGSMLIFLLGLILVNVLHAIVYGAIKKEFTLGKTVESSVKGGYRKTIWTIVDIYAVLLLGALALLVGVAGTYTLALQALICIVTGAFCSLLWARAINFVFLSASKNKFGYFRFVREDDEDDE